MSNKIINGKVALSTKSGPSLKETDDIFGNALAIGDQLKEDLRKQGLVGRWVNAKKLAEFGGYHPKQWRVYTNKESGTIMGAASLSGTDPNGVIRRGDCVLAVKTAEQVAAHKAHLQAKADKYKNFKKQKAAELRQFAKENNIKTVIDDEDEFDE